MTLALHNIRKSKGSSKKKKRVGRGNASGHGTYSTRGLKGQRSRSGGKNKLKLKGMKKIIQNIPKKRGFKGKMNKIQIVNFRSLEKSFNAGEKVNPKSLLKRGIIDNIRDEVKILGDGSLSKKLVIEGCSISKQAKDKIGKLKK